MDMLSCRSQDDTCRFFLLVKSCVKRRLCWRTDITPCCVISVLSRLATAILQCWIIWRIVTAVTLIALISGCSAEISSKPWFFFSFTQAVEMQPERNLFACFNSWYFIFRFFLFFHAMDLLNVLCLLSPPLLPPLSTVTAPPASAD